MIAEVIMSSCSLVRVIEVWSSISWFFKVNTDASSMKRIHLYIYRFYAETQCVSTF